MNLIGAKPWQQIDGCKQPRRVSVLNSFTSRTQMWREEFLTTRSSSLPPRPPSVCLKAVHPPAFRGFAPTMRGSYALVGNRNIDECVCVCVCIFIDQVWCFTFPLYHPAAPSRFHLPQPYRGRSSEPPRVTRRRPRRTLGGFLFTHIYTNKATNCAHSAAKPTLFNSLPFQNEEVWCECVPLALLIGALVFYVAVKFI